jgi:hypothetical protein
MMTVLVRVVGHDFPISMTRIGDGRIHWSTRTRSSELQGTSPSPLDALAAARDALQCAFLDPVQTSALADDKLEALLEASVVLTRWQRSRRSA